VVAAEAPAETAKVAPNAKRATSGAVLTREEMDEFFTAATSGEEITHTGCSSTSYD
jgi:hypothetical protein